MCSKKITFHLILNHIIARHLPCIRLICQYYCECSFFSWFTETEQKEFTELYDEVKSVILIIMFLQLFFSQVPIYGA